MIAEERRIRNRESYRLHRIERAAYNRQWRKNHPDSYIKSIMKNQKNNLDKLRAKIYAQRFVPLKEHCDICGESDGRLERHHPDYSKPLEVLTLCKICHEALHITLREEGKEPQKVNPEVLKNRHCSTCRKTYGLCGRRHPSFNGRPCSLWEPNLIQKEEKTE
jgi:hypothetical protein